MASARPARGRTSIRVQVRDGQKRDRVTSPSRCAVRCEHALRPGDARAGLFAAAYLDKARHHPDPAEKRRSRLPTFTPIAWAGARAGREIAHRHPGARRRAGETGAARVTRITTI
jgi:hypothetical protein